MNKVQSVERELQETKEAVERYKNRLEQMFGLSGDIAEQNRKMKDALYAITQAKGIGAAKMIAQIVLAEIQNNLTE